MQRGYLHCLLLLLAVASFTASRRPLIRAPRDARTTGSHLVVLDKNMSSEEFQRLLVSISKIAGGAAVRRYVENVGKVVTVSLSPYALEMVRRLEGVMYIEEEDEATGDEIPDLPWHIDRLDQASLPLDWSYQPIGTGEGVDVYVLDSGISYNHQEFEYRAKYAGYDPHDAYQRDKHPDAVPMRGRDCHGHGTHVASLCGGKTFGTAKKVTIYSVRVLSCRNSAPWSVVLDGLDFVSQIIPKRMKPAIVTMSLSGSIHSSVNAAIQELYQKNIPVVTVAGNGENDCCSLSPASSPHALTVAGTRGDDGLYHIGQGTNYGECVDLFAPAEQILGANYLCSNCSKILSGTSMAAPLVAGIVAVHLSRQPLMTSAQIMEKMINESVKGAINFQGIPDDYRPVTPNRFATLPGSCGGSTFPLSQSSFHSPMFPDSYPGNLHCLWSISAEEGQQVQVTFHSIRTEQNFDVIQVFDGNNLLATLSGDLGVVGRTIISQSPSLSILFVSDGLTELSGFNATYTKFYKNTDIIVLGPHLPSHTTYPPSTLFIHHQDTKHINRVLKDHKADGYRVTWITTYHSGRESHADMIMTNSSSVDTKCMVEVGNKSLPRIVTEQQTQGYYLWHMSTRTRGRRVVRPAFYLLFKPLPNHLEHVYFIRESEERYLGHLAERRRDNFTLLSHSFYYLDTKLMASSVFVRDRRIPLGIPIATKQPRWISYHNLTFYDLSKVLHNLANQSYFPSFIDSYQGPTNSSRFAVIFTEHLKDVGPREGPEGPLIIWGLNKTAATSLVNERRAAWDPILSLGYDYNKGEEFYVQLVREMYIN